MRSNKRGKVKSAGAASAPPPAKRPVGRPRSEESENAILTVTLKLLGEKGYGGVTIEDIVAQARVSNSTIYRRWPTKEELVVAAFDLLPKLKVPDRGNLITEWLELARQYDRVLHQTPLASVVPALIGEATHNPALAQRIESTFARRRLPGRLIVMRAVERGDLPVETDLEQATELFWAPLVQRSLFGSNLMDLQQFHRMFEVIRAGIWEVHRNTLQTKQGVQVSKSPKAPPSVSRA